MPRRCPTTAALHIAVGDRSQLDVARVDGCSGSQRYFCCMASYGFMGDVMRMSEGYRWMGPARWAARHWAGELLGWRKHSILLVELLATPELL